MQEQIHDFAASVAAIADEFYRADDVDSALSRMVTVAADAIDGCDAASVSLMVDGRIMTPASSGALASEGDELQYDAGDGPCMSAINTGVDVESPDLANDERWPVFAERAAASGVSSMLSCTLGPAGQRLRGSLNFYARRRGAFDGGTADLGRVLAAAIGVVLAAGQDRAGLQAALASRDVIGQAKGVIMTREQITDEAAFERLRDASQRLNRKLRDIAADVAETGEVP